MRDVTLGGKRIRVDTSDPLGEGGEAFVYDISNLSPDTALKLWKPPDHPEFQGTDDKAKRNREGAEKRMREYSQKLREFPTGLPDRVVSPRELATNTSGTKLLGYSMQLLRGAEMLRMLMLPKFRSTAGVDNNALLDLFRDLHGTVTKLHQLGVVVGDFNPRNVLVRGSEAYLIDADSMQFGKYHCLGFTARYVDPLLCNPQAASLIMQRPHSSVTDWYAYALMLFEGLLMVHPYGGTYEPRSASDQVTLDARPLRRITVFTPQVVYPARRTPTGHLPDEVLHFYDRLLHKDERAEFPMKLLDAMRWTSCSKCGTEHARPHCPLCAEANSEARKLVTIRGRVTVEKLFSAGGPILRSAVHNSLAKKETLRVLTHVDGELRRETAQTVLRCDLDTRMKFRVRGADTLVGFGNHLTRIDASGVKTQFHVDTFRGVRPVFDSNERHFYWLSNGRLLRDDTYGPKHIGNVLRNQTYLWVGPSFGFGFYRAGGLQVAFVFDAERSGINDSVKLPAFSGGILDASCFFTESRCWLFVSTEEQGRTVIHCFVIKADGEVVAHAQGEEADGSWLGSLRGKVAATLPGKPSVVHALFAATDLGLVRVEERGGRLNQVADFPDTRGFIASDDTLHLSAQGIVVAGRRDVRRITLRSS
jgi:serine/threonine protein kinase